MEEQKPKRGCFLTGILWLTLVSSSIQIIWYIVARFILPSSKTMNFITAMKVMPIGSFIYETIMNVLSIIAVVLILRWKKQGAYLFAIAGAISFIATFIMLKVDIYMTIGAIIGFIIVLLIAYFSYKAIDKREKFIKEEA